MLWIREQKGQGLYQKYKWDRETWEFKFETTLVEKKWEKILKPRKRGGERVACDDFIEYFYFIYTNQATLAIIYNSGKPDQNRWTKAHLSCHQPSIFRQQLCDLINVLWRDRRRMCWCPAWKCLPGGTRVEVGGHGTDSYQWSRSPHLWLLSSSQTPMGATPTRHPLPSPKLVTAGHQGSPTTHQSIVLPQMDSKEWEAKT